MQFLYQDRFYHVEYWHREQLQNDAKETQDLIKIHGFMYFTLHELI